MANDRRFYGACIDAFERGYTTNPVKQTVTLNDGRIFAFNGSDTFYEVTDSGTNCVVRVKRR